MKMFSRDRERDIVHLLILMAAGSSLILTTIYPHSDRIFDRIAKYSSYAITVSALYTRKRTVGPQHDVIEEMHSIKTLEELKQRLFGDRPIPEDIHSTKEFKQFIVKTCEEFHKDDDDKSCDV